MILIQKHDMTISLSKNAQTLLKRSGKIVAVQNHPTPSPPPFLSLAA